MNLKQKQRLTRAIATTILSFAAVSVAGVDKAQAAVLTYNFQVEQGGPSGFFKFSNSSLTEIGTEEIAVSEGKLNGFTVSPKEYYDLAGAIVLFVQGQFRGLQASGRDSATRKVDFPDAPGGPNYLRYDSVASWNIDSPGVIDYTGQVVSYFSGYRETAISDRTRLIIIDRGSGLPIQGARVSYDLVDTAAEPIPEPITFSGTALALAGLSWLKYKKKTAV